MSNFNEVYNSLYKKYYINEVEEYVREMKSKMNTRGMAQDDINYEFGKYDDIVDTVKKIGKFIFFDSRGKDIKKRAEMRAYNEIMPHVAEEYNAGLEETKNQFYDKLVGDPFWQLSDGNVKFPSDVIDNVARKVEEHRFKKDVPDLNAKRNELINYATETVGRTKTSGGTSGQKMIDDLNKELTPKIDVLYNKFIEQKKLTEEATAQTSAAALSSTTQTANLPETLDPKVGMQGGYKKKKSTKGKKKKSTQKKMKKSTKSKKKKSTQKKMKRTGSKKKKSTNKKKKKSTQKKIKKNRK
jgi:hypothetical protein